MAQVVVVFTEVPGPEKRHVEVVLVAAEHVRRSDPSLLLGQAPMLDALRLAIEREGRDITGGPEPIGHAHTAVDRQ
ncbi:hypothetical protein D3C85_1592230 [compost metagenome]